MKTKIKLLFDILIALILIICMKYNFTGGFIHEILGTTLIIGLILHILINCKYYFSMFKNIKNLSKLKFKHKANLFMNLFLVIPLVFMSISSIAISKDLFSFMNFTLGSYELWLTIHIISALILLICGFIHLFLHIKHFNAFLNKKALNKGTEKIWNGFTSVIAILTSIFVFVTSIHTVKNNFVCDSPYRGGYRKPEHYENYIYEKDVTKESTTKEYVTEETTSAPFLEEYLSKLFCNGCGRHCPLTNPKCRKGTSKAAEAEKKYLNEYGTSN